MKRKSHALQRITIAASLIGLLVFIIGLEDCPAEKAKPVTYPSLWECFDRDFQDALLLALQKEFRGKYRRAVGTKKAAIVVVDITDLKQPKVAALNPDVMLYAASLPKIAILLGAFVQIERGQMEMNDQTRAELTLMIRNSSNKAATAVLHRVGFENLAEILQSEKYRLYDPKHGGGLWVGRDYGGGRQWKRDPLNNISHGATAMQAARFYYLAETGRLVSPEYFDDLVEIMSKPAIQHKFVKGIRKNRPDAKFMRKSGTWKGFHADSGVIYDTQNRYKYIIVGLTEHPQGGEGLARFAAVVDQVMDTMHRTSK